MYAAQKKIGAPVKNNYDRYCNLPPTSHQICQDKQYIKYLLSNNLTKKVDTYKQIAVNLKS